MRKIILITSFCLFTTILKSAESSKPTGIIKPREMHQKKIELEQARARNVVKMLNIALYYSDLAKKELEKNIAIDNSLPNSISDQIVHIEQRTRFECQLIKHINMQEAALQQNRTLLLNSLETKQAIIIDTTFDTIFIAQPVQLLPAIAIETEINQSNQLINQ